VRGEKEIDTTSMLIGSNNWDEFKFIPNGIGAVMGVGSLQPNIGKASVFVMPSFL